MFMATINIIRVFHLSTEQERVAGFRWYQKARELVHELDPQHPHRAAGIIAALSPLKNWAQNVNAARAFYAGYRNMTLRSQIRKAEQISTANSIEEIVAILNGPKIISFFRCIIQEDSNEVCVDRHALDISRGYSLLYKNEKLRSTYLSRKGNYNKVQDEYRKAAKRLGLTPHEVQAVTWLTWRRLKLTYGTNFKLSEVLLAA